MLNILIPIIYILFQIQKIIPRKLNFNSSSTKSEPSEPTKPAVLQVSEVSDKMCKFGGVKVLPDIKSQPTVVNFVVPVTNVEKQQNATVIDVEGDSGIETKTPTSFDEVDLATPGAHQPEKSSLTSTFKDHNMKKVLVKGIQNLKEKLNNHIQKSNEKVSSKENAFESHKVEPDSQKTETVPVEAKPGEEVELRLRSNSDGSEAEEMAKKINKRKAPPPPPVALSDTEKDASDFNLLNEIENEVNKNNYDCKDSDSETEADAVRNTIELNSSHITVHHMPEESSRKASSLGDLSKIGDNDLSLVPLERAVSLELTEHTPRGSKKRKAPMPPEESSDEALFKEPKLEPVTSSKLKKSNMFGTLEEAVKQTESDSDDSDHEDLLTSTPMKLVDDQFPPVDACSNISWELNFDLQDESKDDVFLADEKVPDLPTSPMPNLPTYVTEIKVSNDNETTSVNSSDVTLFLTAAEASSDESCLANSSSTFENDDETKSPTITDYDEKMDSHELESEGSKDDSSIDTVKDASCNGSVEESHSNKTESVDSKSAVSSNKVFRFSKENMSDEQILAMNTTSTQPTPRYRSGNESSPTKIKSPGSTTKLPKLSQSISPVRAVGSRIPVRANTEPSLKVSLINKDDVLSKTRKYKLSDDAVENGKVTFTSTNHLPSSVHKTSVLSESRHNGPNR